jgi:orotate phosphoribosyltransferase
MDETTRQIIEHITVRFPKPTQIRSGQVCSVYFDCIQLSPNDLARLAAEATGHLPSGSFEIAVGLAYTGVLFAAAVASGERVTILQEDGAFFGPKLSGKRVVVVDDVVHRGNRIGRAVERAQREGAHVVGMACIVDRSAGQVARADLPLWSAYQTSME